MNKSIVGRLVTILLAAAVLCNSERVDELGLDDSPAEYFDTFVTIRIIDRKGKHSISYDSLKRDFQCLDKMRPVLISCLEEKLQKTLNIPILFFQPNCAAKIEKFKMWANDTCDGLIGFSNGTGTVLDSQPWFFRVMLWLKSVVNFFKYSCKD